MLLLNNTTSLLKVITAGSQAIDVTVDWMDDLAGAITPGTLNTAISSATTTTVCVSPAGSTSRNIKTITIRNTDASASDLITVERYDGTTTSTMWQFALQPGYSWTYMDFAPIVTDTNGGQYVTPLAGRFLKTTLLTSTASANFVTGPQTNTCKIRQVGGGAQGGGAPATTGENGSGGGAGAYAEATQAVTPNTSYTYQCGAAGTTGGTGANGQAGANTTSTIGAVLITSPGGSNGLVGASIALHVAGGLGGTISTQGSAIGALLAGGMAGDPSYCIGTAVDNGSGAGGSSQFGAGGAGQLNISNATGLAAVGYGGGGGGATTTGTARAGGAGSPGCIVVDEYS